MHTTKKAKILSFALSFALLFSLAMPHSVFASEILPPQSSVAQDSSSAPTANTDAAQSESLPADSTQPAPETSISTSSALHEPLPQAPLVVSGEADEAPIVARQAETPPAAPQENEITTLENLAPASLPVVEAQEIPADDGITEPGIYSITAYKKTELAININGVALTGTNETLSVQIAADTTLILREAHITSTTASPIETMGANCVLVLVGKNTVAVNGLSSAGVHVPPTTSISIHGPGTLTTTGGKGDKNSKTGGGAGIGGAGSASEAGEASGAITITNATIVANGGDGDGWYSGAGIGGGGSSSRTLAGGAGNNITIKDNCNITATGGTGGAGIGGGGGDVAGATGSNIKISNYCTVKATGNGGAGIGGGYRGAGSDIIITDDCNVEATGGNAGGAGIGGGGAAASGSDIEISNKCNVKATGGNYGGAGIGGGGGDVAGSTGSNIVISNNCTVKAKGGGGGGSGGSGGGSGIGGGGGGYGGGAGYGGGDGDAITISSSCTLLAKGGDGGDENYSGGGGSGIGGGGGGGGLGAAGAGGAATNFTYTDYTGTDASLKLVTGSTGGAGGAGASGDGGAGALCGTGGGGGGGGGTAGGNGNEEDFGDAYATATGPSLPEHFPLSPPTPAPVVTPPTITTHPENKTANIDETVGFTIDAENSDGAATNVVLTFQWQACEDDSTWKNLVDDSNITGAQTSSLTLKKFASADSKKYRCEVMYAYVATTISTEATLTVATYGIDLASSAEKIFAAQIVGYATPETHTVEVTNTGNMPTGVLTVALSGTGEQSFTVLPASIAELAAGGNAFFTVKPNLGLLVGSHSATVTVSGGNGISASFAVGFEVTPDPASSSSSSSPTSSSSSSSPTSDGASSSSSSSPAPTVKPAPAVTKVKMGQTKVTIPLKKSYIPTYAVYTSDGSKDTLTWTTSNAKIAKVTKGGKITAIKKGKATITASATNGKKARITVTVVAASAKKTNPTEVTLAASKSYTPSVSLHAKGEKKGALTWKTSNAKIAKVSKDGKITAVKKGTATITAEATNGKKLHITVTVVPASAKNAKVKKVSASVPKSMKVNTVRDITGNYSPASVTNVRITYKTSNAKIATIDEVGRITAKRAGEVTITVTAGRVSKVYNLTVNK